MVRGLKKEYIEYRPLSQGEEDLCNLECNVANLEAPILSTVLINIISASTDNLKPAALATTSMALTSSSRSSIKRDPSPPTSRRKRRSR